MVSTVDAVHPIERQHAEEAAFLWRLRTAAVGRPGVKLDDLSRLDRRLAIHLQALVAIGDRTGGSSTDGEPDDEAGVFVGAVLALESRLPQALLNLIRLAKEDLSIRRGVIAALGWVSGAKLMGTVKTLLTSPEACARDAGLAACVAHGVNPGAALDAAVREPEPSLRANGLLATGVLGRTDLLPSCERHLTDDSLSCRESASYSSVLLGNRSVAVRTLMLGAGASRIPEGNSCAVALQAMTVPAAHAALQQLPSVPERTRSVTRGSGIVGDPSYVPWLIRVMSVPEMARLAGEAFTLITGADLASLDLEGTGLKHPLQMPDGLAGEPGEVADLDDGLLWPDQAKVDQWWTANSHRFTAGQRYFMGAPVTRDHCIEVLKNGYQRQRILAAHYLCLLNPGTALFNTSAPAWRQQRLLAQM